MAKIEITQGGFFENAQIEVPRSITTQLGGNRSYTETYPLASNLLELIARFEARQAQTNAIETELAEVSKLYLQYLRNSSSITHEEQNNVVLAIINAYAAGFTSSEIDTLLTGSNGKRMEQGKLPGF